MTSISNVTLRPLWASDFKVYYQLISDPSIAEEARFQPVRNKQKAWQLLKTDLKNNYNYAVTLNEKMIGALSLYSTIGKQNQPDYRHLELAYMMLPSQQSHGYMTQAVGQLIKYLKHNSSIKQLVALVSEGNQASRKVLWRNHFRSYHSVLDMFSGRDDLVYQLNLSK